MRVRGVGKGMPGAHEPIRPANISQEEWERRHDNLDWKNYETSNEVVKSRNGRTVYRRRV